MALQAINPNYKTWVQDIDATTISTKIKELNQEFSDIVEQILYSQTPDKLINKKIDDIRNKLLYLQLAYKQLTPTPELTSMIDTLSDSVNLINTYESRETQIKQKRSIDILTVISVILLPLTLITGWYGMNFGSMASPTTKKGVFSLKYGQLYVLIIFAIAIVVSILILKHFYTIT